MTTYVETKDGREVDISNLGLNIYDKNTRHELKRFSQMSEIQLFTRLGKITTKQKLIDYSRMAEIFGYPDLSIAAAARCKKLHNFSPKKLNFEPKLEAREIGERLLRRIDV